MNWAGLKGSLNKTTPSKVAITKSTEAIMEALLLSARVMAQLYRALGIAAVKMPRASTSNEHPGTVNAAVTRQKPLKGATIRKAKKRQ